MAKKKTADAAASPEAQRRHPRKTMEGVVVSDKMNKTRIVSVERAFRHPFYEKIIKKRSRFAVHDEANDSREGDVVEIMSTRPVSKSKRWRLVRVVKSMPRVAEAKA
ncbi:MAG: 30S ribosomal protein S17 [Elusimicrobia bacterium]|nr:30S ribosomal protein S17 [Elusimicrobiota bacterium]MDE2425319.1 30S ribosomal protein S17 [Elusimicrobiota bacterium]